MDFIGIFMMQLHIGFQYPNHQKNSILCYEKETNFEKRKKL